MEKQFTLVMLSEMLSKFLMIEGKDTIVKGYIKGIVKNDSGLYDVKLSYGSHSFTEEQMATLYYDREVNGNIFLFDNEQDCLNNIKFMRENASHEVISAKTEHTTDDVWKERWWQAFLKCGLNRSVEQAVMSTNEIITIAMKEMENFFKDK